MISKSFTYLLLLGATRLSLGQYGSFGVGSSCSTNLNCGGNSICQSQRCACPMYSQQYGQSCYGGGYGGYSGYGSSYGGYGGSYGGYGSSYGGYGGGYGGYSGGGMGGLALIIQPGGSCSGGMGGGYCGGGSSCNSGYCNCPQNTIMSSSYCQPINTVYPGDACNLYNQCGGGSFCQNSVCCCPTGFSNCNTGCCGGSSFGGNYGGNFGGNYGSNFGGNYGGYSMGNYGGIGGGNIQITISPGQSCGGNFGGGSCGGGSSCNQGFCTCPPNCIVQNNQCMPYGGGNSFGGIGGMYNNYQSGMGIGGFCNQQSSCGYNAQCINNACQCSAGYYPQNGGCYRKKFYRSDSKQKLVNDNDLKSNKIV